MKTILKYIAMTMFTLLLSCLCFILPPEFSSYKDSKTVGQVNLESLEETNVVLKKQMTILEKISLLSGQDINTNGITIRQGKELTEEKAKKACKEETVKLKELGVLENTDFGVDFDKDYAGSQINFYISIADPSKSVIIWNAIFIHDNKSVIISLDDETGKITGIVSSDYSIFYPGGGYEQLIKALGSYLGLEVRKIDLSESLKEYDSAIYNKNIGLNVTFSDGKQELDSMVYMFKTGFSLGEYDYGLYNKVYNSLS